MKLEPLTLATVAFGLALAQALFLGMIWRLHRSQVGVAAWAAAEGLRAIALALYATRTWTTDPWISRVAPTFFMGAMSLCLFMGACALRGRRPRLGWPAMVSGACMVGFIVVVLHNPGSRLRPMMAMPLIVLPLLLAARELLGETRQELRFSGRFSGGAMLAYAALMVARTIVLQLGEDVPHFLDPSPPQTLAVLSQLFCGLLLTLGAVLHVSQHQWLALKHADEALLEARDAAWMLERRWMEQEGQRQRQSLLRDLHDGLAGITANLALAATNGPLASTPTPDRLQHIRQLAAEGNQELRMLMDSLDQHETSWTETLGVLRARTLGILQARDIEGTWTVSGTVPTQPIRNPAALFSLTRVLKEAVANVARHSLAHHASVRFCFGCGRVIIRVHDDGLGLMTDRPTSGGRGMTYMRQRVSELGGTLRVHVHGGTRLRLVLPLPLAFRQPDDNPPPLAKVHAGGEG